MLLYAPLPLRSLESKVLLDLGVDSALIQNSSVGKQYCDTA